MAKGRVAVLEAHAPQKISAAKAFCGTGIAEIMVKQCEARRIGKRLIQMVRGEAKAAIKQAKAVRDSALREVEKTKHILFDGPMGVGNLLPFAKPRCDGSKLHYELPPAGDRTPYQRSRRKFIKVSSRSIFSQPGVQWANYVSGAIA
jgi:hypothetical protein